MEVTLTFKCQVKKWILPRTYIQITLNKFKLKFYKTLQNWNLHITLIYILKVTCMILKLISNENLKVDLE